MYLRHVKSRGGGKIAPSLQRCNLNLSSTPVFSDGELILNDLEVKLIFKFFWPELGAPIDQMQVGIAEKKLAQTILVVAIDSSYAIGFMQGLVDGYAKPHAGVVSASKKLAQEYMKHWWKHATKKDLTKIQINESVRKTVAVKWKPEIRMALAN